MLRFAQALLSIGELYYSCQEDLNKVNSMREALSRAETEKAKKGGKAGEKAAAAYEDLTSPEIRELESAARREGRGLWAPAQ